VPDPRPAPGAVRIRVHAVGINFADLLQRMGLYPGTPRPPFIPGLEVAGIVEEVVAPSETDPALWPGDGVVALPKFNAYTERVAVPAKFAFRLPDGIHFEDAAAIPVNYLTAYHSMFQMGNLHWATVS
jgi:NADPH:quinone reductase-like Zn-dependent oxidoreductase